MGWNHSPSDRPRRTLDPPPGLVACPDCGAKGGKYIAGKKGRRGEFITCAGCLGECWVEPKPDEDKDDAP